MNVYRNLKYQLGVIKQNPNQSKVTITDNNREILFQFHGGYYFHNVIQRISFQKGGAGVIYVYTTSERYPHLTIPETGQNLHWTLAPEKRSQWPEAVGVFIDELARPYSGWTPT
jgi:hypothetical protein